MILRPQLVTVVFLLSTACYVQGLDEDEVAAADLGAGHNADTDTLNARITDAWAEKKDITAVGKTDSTYYLVMTSGFDFQKQTIKRPTSHAALKKAISDGWDSGLNIHDVSVSGSEYCIVLSKTPAVSRQSYKMCDSVDEIATFIDDNADEGKEVIAMSSDGKECLVVTGVMAGRKSQIMIRESKVSDFYDRVRQLWREDYHIIAVVEHGQEIVATLVTGINAAQSLARKKTWSQARSYWNEKWDQGFVIAGLFEANDHVWVIMTKFNDLDPEQRVIIFSED